MDLSANGSLHCNLSSCPAAPLNYFVIFYTLLADKDFICRCHCELVDECIFSLVVDSLLVIFSSHQHHLAIELLAV